jgi:hypothetical protein
VPNFAFRFNWTHVKQGRRGQQHYPVLFLADESVTTAHCVLSGGTGDRQEFQRVAWLTAGELTAVAEPDKLRMLLAMMESSTAQLLATAEG